MIYRIPVPHEDLSQGDILDDCPVFGLECGTESVDLDAEPIRWRARVIVLTQACDLANTKTTRAVFAIVHPAQILVDQNQLTASVIRDRVRRHQVFGWYFLPEFPDAGFPKSIVDLRNLHTIPRVALQTVARQGKRLSRLETPFREHLAQHFASTYSRIGLPEPYETNP
jgi:hypothetical protein